MADPTSRPTSRPTYPTDLPTDLANYKRARHIPKSRPILENPPPKKSIMPRKNWPCVVVVVFRIYFFLNKKKKGYRDMADPTSRPPDLPTSRPPNRPAWRTNTHAPPPPTHQHTRAADTPTPGGDDSQHTPDTPGGLRGGDDTPGGLRLSRHIAANRSRDTNIAS